MKLQALMLNMESAGDRQCLILTGTACRPDIACTI